jgi:nucleotide-binding universal stress UspA family protein
MPLIRRHILVPTDFSEPARTSLLVARDHAEHFEAQLTIAHVLHLTSHLFGDGVYAYGDAAKKMQDAAETAVQDLAAEMRATGINAQGVVLLGAPHEMIPQFSRDNGVDLIVISTHGRTGVASVAFGSVTQRVLLASPCALLVLPPHHRHGAHAPGV